METNDIAPWWPAIYTALGAFIAILGQFLLDWLKARRELKIAKRHSLQQELYAVQDQIVVLFQLTRKQISDSTDPFNPQKRLFIDADQLRNAATKMSIHTVRVGDDPLSQCIDKLLKSLHDATQNPSASSSKFTDAHKHLNDAQLRIGKLLHTNAEIDTGV